MLHPPSKQPSAMNVVLDKANLEEALQTLVKDLQLERQDKPHWTGKLSTSALSTATAISALSVTLEARSQRGTTSPSPFTDQQLQELAYHGCCWLLEHQNSDGGFGDTDRSHSNISTTLLVLAAWKLAKFTGHNGRDVQEATESAWRYVEQQGGWAGLRKRYGKDKTFVVPILSNCALAGLVSWKEVPSLPFELAALPQAWYRFVRMPVVSYAVPALVAIGQAKHFHSPTRFLPWRWVRNSAITTTRRVLRQMQPDSGGYLEAVPLTSFVLMSLSSIGCHEHVVANHAIRFIVDSVLPDGSWPIDTNLATWVTSLSIKALARASGPHNQGPLKTDQWLSLVNPETIDWLLYCQHRIRHPFTGADPGGWGWTNLSGAVPDADDTPAALLALREYWDRSSTVRTAAQSKAIAEAVELGVRWLLGLQNRDGGWPTFCRGWGTLPFDRSGTDLTAHAMRALDAWGLGEHASAAKLSEQLTLQIRSAHRRGLDYLTQQQLEDGSWLALWFGNQDHSGEDNPIYGTSRVLLALNEVRAVRDEPKCVKIREKGLRFLLSSQNRDGGWGGGKSVPYRVKLDGSEGKEGSSIEETAVALEALLSAPQTTLGEEATIRGLNWLSKAIGLGYHRTSWPIGFYFAKLWYHEKLYPLVFSLAAVGLALQTKTEHQA